MNVFTASDLEAAGLLARHDDGGAPSAVTPPPASDRQGPAGPAGPVVAVVAGWGRHVARSELVAGRDR